MKGKSKAFLIILAVFSALFFISDLSQAAITPECPTGYTYNLINSRCEGDPSCSNGGSYDAEKNYCLLTPTCSSGYIFNSSGNQCEKDPYCTNGGSYDAEKNYCLLTPTCSSGYIFNSLANQCEKDPYCTNGGSYDAEKNYCLLTPTCSSGYIFNSLANQCEKDPQCPCGSYDSTVNYCKFSANITYDSNGNIITLSCPCGGSYVGNEMCGIGVICTDGGYFSGAIDKCYKTYICPSDYGFSTTYHACVQGGKCTDGGYFSGAIDKCYKTYICPSDYGFSTTYHACVQGGKCTDGGYFSGAIDKCYKTYICPSDYGFSTTYHMCIQGAQCLGGGSYSGGTVDKCIASPYPVDASEINNTCEVRVGLPVSVSSGVVYANETDFTINGTMPISFTRFHNSKTAQTLIRSFGRTWGNNFDTKVEVYSAYTIYKITDPDGSITYYLDQNGDKIYETDLPKGETSKLIKNTDNTFKRIYKDGSSEEFNRYGYLIAIVDKNGNRLTLTRDTSNKLTKITDPAGREINITYNASNYISQITLPDGNAITYTYVSNNLQKITYLDGTYKTYEYSSYKLTGIKNEKGNYIEKHTYDTQGRGITSSADGTNDLLTISYINDTQTTVTDSLGRTTTYTYDKSKGKGHLISRTGPGCQSCGQGNVAYTYDDKLNITSETDALGNVTAYTYDANGSTLTKTEASGTALQRTTTYTYNSLNDLIEQTGPTGTKTQFQYDAKRNLIKVLTLNSQLQTLTQAALTRNTKGQITKIQALDPNNQVLSETNIAYDTYGNITSITDALSNVTTYTYDIMGKPLTATDANGKTTTLSYDQRARLISTKDSLNNITAYTYDQAGSLITLTDAKSNATQFTYDTIGRLTKQTDPMAKQTIYTYDSQGNLTSKTDPNGNTIQYTYDALNRLVQKTYPDASASGGTTTYAYDAIGNLTSASNAYISYSFAYDALGRMTSVTDSLGKSISYVYDANSNRTSMTSPIGTTSYSYNALNLLTSLSTTINSQLLTFNFAYDSLGRRTNLSMPNGTTTSYSYDSLSRLTNLSTLNSALSTINSFTYTYDSVGNKLTKQYPAGTHNYSYDNTYQLTQATHPPEAGKPNEAFSYDAVGNRSNTTVDAANKLLQDPNASYQYDANGNRYIKTQSDGSVVYYSYDYEGRLTRVESQKPGLTSIAVYKYDPLGRRFEKNVDGVVTRYLYSNEGLIAEYDINNNLKKSYGWMPNGIWGTDPLYMTENNQTYFYHNDALGTPQKMTDASGTVVWSAAYTAFGEATIDPSSTITNNLRFAGQYFDQETGNHYNLFRYYDPSTGTYVSKDPSLSLSGRFEIPYLLPKLLNKPQTLHPYLYTVNNPVKYADPLGLLGWDTAINFLLKRVAGKAVDKILSHPAPDPNECVFKKEEKRDGDIMRCVYQCADNKSNPHSEVWVHMKAGTGECDPSFITKPWSEE